MLKKIGDMAYPLLFLLLIAIAWEWCVRFFSIPHYLLPGPLRILGVMADKWELLLQNSFITVAEILLGFALALISGMLLAFAIHYSNLLKRTLMPLVIASQTIPVFAIAPLLILWFGYGIGSKVVMAAIIVFFPIVVNTVEGLNAADPDIVSLFRILGASKWQILLKVRVPQALPFMFSGMKIGAAVSVIGAVIGEWVGARQGLGYLMVHANAQLQVDLVFAAIIWLSVLGILLYAAIGFLERLFVRG